MAHIDDRYSSLLRVGIIDVATMRYLCLFLFGVYSNIYIELMYLDQIELM